MPRRVRYIEVVGDAIVFFGSIVGRAPAKPDRHVITTTRELLLLDSTPRRETLKWNGTAVVKRAATELRAMRKARSDSVATERAARVDNEVIRALVNQRLAAIGQPEITKAEEVAARKAIRDARRLP